MQCKNENLWDLPRYVEAEMKLHVVWRVLHNLVNFHVQDNFVGKKGIFVSEM